jgi:hypothetical protein
LGRKAVFEEVKAGRSAVQELANLELVRKARPICDHAFKDASQSLKREMTLAAGGWLRAPALSTDREDCQGRRPSENYSADPLADFLSCYSVDSSVE